MSIAWQGEQTRWVRDAFRADEVCDYCERDFAAEGSRFCVKCEGLILRTRLAQYAENNVPKRWYSDQPTVKDQITYVFVEKVAALFDWLEKPIVNRRLKYLLASFAFFFLATVIAAMFRHFDVLVELLPR